MREEHARSRGREAGAALGLSLPGPGPQTAEPKLSGPHCRALGAQAEGTGKAAVSRGSLGWTVG